MFTLGRLNSNTLFVSFRGQLKKDNSWVIFDNYSYNDKNELFFTGFDLEGKEIFAVEDEIMVSDSNIDYSIDFLESKTNEMGKALLALKKMKTQKEN
jgi:hypothetical protein